MFSMFKAIVRFSEDKENLVQCKLETSTRSRSCEDARDKSTALRAHYEEEFKIRADMEGLMLEYMKKERFYKSRVASFMEKVRVARLLNEVSMNGHTAISWAAANGAYELVEEMLSHGATVGFPIPLLNLTATFLQYSYKIYRMNCAFRYKPSEDDEDNPSKPPPPKVDSIQFVRDVTAMKELRDKVLSKLTFLRSKTRFPIPEAVYAGKWEIVKRIYERRLYHAQFSNTWAFPSAPFPYLRKLEKTYDRTKMSIREVLSYGMNDNAAGNMPCNRSSAVIIVDLHPGPSAVFIQYLCLVCFVTLPCSRCLLFQAVMLLASAGWDPTTTASPSARPSRSWRRSCWRSAPRMTRSGRAGSASASSPSSA
jgi:hypothetical protein